MDEKTVLVSDVPGHSVEPERPAGWLGKAARVVCAAAAACALCAAIYVLGQSAWPAAMPAQEVAVANALLNVSHLVARGRINSTTYASLFYLSAAGDPYGQTSVNAVNTGPGSIMKQPIPFLAGTTNPVTLAGGGSVPTRITRTRVSKKPGMPSVSANRVPITTTTTTVRGAGENERCGAAINMPCLPGLCCSVYGWCGFSDAHCGSGCQLTWGRCAAPNSPPAPPPPPPPPVPSVPASPATKAAGVIAYFPSWGGPITWYDLSGIDVINYAFVKMNSDGSLAWGGDYWSYGSLYQLNNVYKAKYPRLKTVFSIGGWTDSQWFSVVAADPVRRARFADSVASFMQNNQFDGVDLDWEYPTGGGQPGNTASPNDAANFVLMVSDIRKKIGWGKLITVAVGFIPDRIGSYLVPLANQLDWINVMTYDYAGSWNPTSGLNSPLFSSSSNSYSQADTMAAYVRAGVPRGKLTLGLSFYGRGYYVDSAYNGGLGARQTGVPSAGSEPGVYTWKALRSGVLSNGPYSPAWDFQRVYRTDIQNPTLYSPSQKIFIAYDDPRSICYKTLWSKSQGFGGVMVWDLTMDTNNREMMNAMADSWSGRRTACDTN